MALWLFYQNPLSSKQQTNWLSCEVKNFPEKEHKVQEPASSYTNHYFLILYELFRILPGVFR